MMYIPKPILLFITALLFVISGNNPANAQYTLPHSDVLAKNQIHVIHVTKTPLRLENRNKDVVTDASFNRTPLNLATYFINAAGKIDSVYHYPNDSGYYKKDVLKYDELGRPIELTTTSTSGKAEQRVYIEKTSSGELLWYQWENGLLKATQKITPDSIVIETVGHRAQAPSYVTYTYNLQQDIEKQILYLNNEVFLEKTCQWIAENGIPKYFVYNEYESGSDPEEFIEKNRHYEVDEDGNVINELSGLIFDPFRMYNYYNRHKRFEGIIHAHQSRFKTDTLIKTYEASELHSFDGTEIVYCYTFNYK